jgi:hypothetical protein
MLIKFLQTGLLIGACIAGIEILNRTTPTMHVCDRVKALDAEGFEKTIVHCRWENPS